MITDPTETCTDLHVTWGGFTVSEVWSNGQLISATILSGLGEPCVVRSAARLVVEENGKAVAVKRPEPSVISFKTKARTTYILTPETSVK